MRQCKTCKIEKTFDSFYKSKYGFKMDCKPCYSQNIRKFYANNPVANRRRKDANRERLKKRSKIEYTYAWWNRKYQHLKRRARLRSKDFSLTCEQFMEVFGRTDCFYCGIAFSSKTWEVRTIDRVDNAIGYNSGNCVASCMGCNRHKYYIDSPLGEVIRKKRDEFLMERAAN